MNTIIATILILVAHGDDVVVSANYLGTVCADPSTRCVGVAVTDGSASGDKRAYASMNMEYIPLHFTDLPGNTPQRKVIQQWHKEVTEYGYQSFQAGVIDLIKRIDPDKIIVLDPRHGTGGHTSHLVLGWHTIYAANSIGYGDTVWVQSATRHIADSHFAGTVNYVDKGEDFSGFSMCTPDEKAMVVKDGWMYTYNFLKHYPELFDADKLLKAPDEWRQSVFLKWDDQDPEDVNYSRCKSIWR